MRWYGWIGDDPHRYITFNLLKAWREAGIASLVIQVKERRVGAGGAKFHYSPSLHCDDHLTQEQTLLHCNSILQMCSPPYLAAPVSLSTILIHALACRCVHSPTSYVNIRDKLFRGNWLQC